MRIVALADRPPHGDLEALVHRSRAAAVLCLGDLDPAWIEPLERVRVPKLGVYGNHDHEAYMDWYGIEDLHLRAAQVDGVSFSGFEGCVRYKRDGDHMFSQRAARRLVRDLPPADVLLCHCPPAGVNDDPQDRAHVGFEALREWVERHRPRHLLHGHTHPHPGRIVERLGDTRVHYLKGARAVALEL
jgi:Icc-related predicted phosphoesterase